MCTAVPSQSVRRIDVMSTSTAEASRDGYALAYREARMGLEDQERSVVELRARSQRGAEPPTAQDADGVFRVGAVLLVVEVLAWVVALMVQR
jgi:hypothetical protein